MDRLFWETYNMTLARQAGREATSNASALSEGARTGRGGTQQHTNSPQTVWRSWHTGRSAYVPSSAGKLGAAIEKHLASSKFIIMWGKCIFKTQHNAKTTAASIFCRGVGHLRILILSKWIEFIFFRFQYFTFLWNFLSTPKIIHKRVEDKRLS